MRRPAAVLIPRARASDLRAAGHVRDGGTPAQSQPAGRPILTPERPILNPGLLIRLFVVGLSALVVASCSATGTSSPSSADLVTRLRHAGVCSSAETAPKSQRLSWPGPVSTCVARPRSAGTVSIWAAGSHRQLGTVVDRTRRATHHACSAELEHPGGEPTATVRFYRIMLVQGRTWLADAGPHLLRRVARVLGGQLVNVGC